MRKALFAIVLVSASFAGGAVVNGPGLRWAQTLVMNRLGIEEDEPSTANASAEEIPSRPIPPLILEPAAPGTRAEASPKRATSPSPSSSSSSTASALPGLAPVPEGATPPLDPIPPLSASRDPGPAETPPLAAATPDQDKDKEKASEKSDDPSVRRASVANLGDPSPADAPTAAAAATSTPGDWSEVRETMRKLGVSRYGIDGDPAGRVRFHCVIPLAGRRAVGQHFEAEGDDDLQAARSALKRVALWKAAGGAP